MGLLGELSGLIIVSAFLVTLLAGFVKGAVGFAMPMIMISGLATFLPAETALAALIIPTLLTNTIQALRHGWHAALRSVVKFRIYLGIMLVFLVASAQLIRVLPAGLMFLLIGVPVVIFSLIQLLGWTPRIPMARRRLAEALIGAGAGFVGGMSGVWGPPLVAYLTAIGTDKAEQMRVQGVVYGLGAVALAVAHVKSGVLNMGTLPLSLAMVVPALVGMGLGLLVHDRLPQAGFRRMTLFVLILAGVNLVRRGMM